MSNQAFTVLMSVYIKEKPEYLKETLDSLDRQTLQASEILILCDGPLTDDLNNILNHYKNKKPHHVRIIRFENNRGLGKTLADGVNLSKNSIIARMDTDDIAREDRFEKQIGYLLEYPQVGLIGSDINEFENDSDKPYAKRVVPHSHDEILKFVKRRNPFNHMTVMYRKKEVLAAGNYQDLNGYEDYYLWSRMLKQGTISANIAEPLVSARADKEMYKRRGGWQYFKDGLKAYNKIYDVGLASPMDKMIRLSGQAFINLVPNRLRAKLYEYILRK